MSRKCFFSKYLFRIENFLSQNILKVFLETTLVHVSCYPDHYEPKMFFRFSKFATTQYPSIYAFGLEVSPCKCDLRRQASPVQLELESGSSRYRRYVSRMNGSTIFFLKTTFLHGSLYPVHYKPKFFFSKLVKMKILITKSTKIVQLVLRKLVKN